MFFPSTHLERRRVEILAEMEEHKNRLMSEMSGVDAETLKRLRDLMADYYTARAQLALQAEGVEKLTADGLIAYRKELDDLNRRFVNDIDTVVMSRDIAAKVNTLVNEEVADHIDNIVQTKGYDTGVVMSQKATTDVINDLEAKTYGVVVPTEWEIGSLNTKDGSAVEHAKHFRMVEMGPIANDLILEVDRGYAYCIYLYGATGNFISHTTWVGSETEITTLDFSTLYSGAVYYRINVHRRDNGALGELVDEVAHVRILRKNTVTKNTEVLCDNIAQGNLFDPNNAAMGYGLSSAGTSYAEPNRWCTGFVPVDSTAHTGVIVSPATSIRSYDSNYTFLGTVSNADGEGKCDFIEGTAFVRIQYAVSNVPFEERHRVTVCYTDDAERCLPYHILNGEKFGYVDKQYFTKKDIAKHANADGSFTVSFTRWITAGVDWAKNMIITARAKYVLADGYTAPPTIQFSEIGEGSSTIKYIMGALDEYEVKEWRLPSFQKGYPCMKINVNIPEGCTLYIEDFHNRFDDSVQRHADGVRFNAHHGVSNIAPSGTKPAVMLAVRLGYPACIVTPKRTSDGVWIAYHDDTLTSDTFIRQNGGSTLPTEFFGKRFSAISYEDIKTWDFGISINYTYAGTRAMKIEDFFKICAKTGMMPMLSIHPAEVVTTANMEEIRAMAKKCGVLGRLGIKIPTWTAGSTYVANGLRIAFDVFGYDIESYTMDLQSAMPDKTLGIQLFDGLNIDKSKVRCVIECFAPVATESLVESVLISGYEFGISEASHTWNGVATSALNADELEYWIARGVREFTDKYNYSSGLNW